MIDMSHERFEEMVEQTFHRLPDRFRDAVENLAIFTEDYPADDIVRSMHLPSKYHLLGLYQGIPLTKRGTWYGMTPAIPDKIFLYRKNILAQCRSDGDVDDRIYEVLVHEIGHYFGMNEDEIRAAGY